MKKWGAHLCQLFPETIICCLAIANKKNSSLLAIQCIELRLGKWDIKISVHLISHKHPLNEYIWPCNCSKHYKNLWGHVDWNLSIAHSCLPFSDVIITHCGCVFPSWRVRIRPPRWFRRLWRSTTWRGWTATPSAWARCCPKTKVSANSQGTTVLSTAQELNTQCSLFFSLWCEIICYKDEGINCNWSSIPITCHHVSFWKILDLDWMDLHIEAF